MTRHENTDILKVVSLITGVSIDEIKSKNRNGEFVSARHIYSYAVSKYGTQIGAGILINRDRTTISYGKKQIEKYLSNKKEIELRKTVESILSTLEAYVFQRPCVRFGRCKYQNGFKIPDEEIDPNRQCKQDYGRTVSNDNKPGSAAPVYQDSEVQ